MREGQGYPCYQCDMMMMMISYVVFFVIVEITNRVSCNKKQLILKDKRKYSTKLMIMMKNVKILHKKK